jgi:hypothetical protein
MTPAEAAMTPMLFLKLTEWAGPPIANTYGNKAVVDWKGEPLFAELAIF